MARARARNKNKARKVPCEHCGAKNKPEVRRCRVCTTVLNPDTSEQSTEKSAGSEVGESDPSPTDDQSTAAESDEPFNADDLASTRPTEPAPPTGEEVADADAEPFDPSGLDIDHSKQPRPGPPDISDETFDADGLVVEHDTKAAEGPIPEFSNERFDPEALDVRNHADPRPT